MFPSRLFGAVFLLVSFAAPAYASEKAPPKEQEIREREIYVP